MQQPWETVKKPEDVTRLMSGFSYDNFTKEEDYIVKTPEVLYKERKGVCYDFVEFERECFKVLVKKGVVTSFQTHFIYQSLPIDTLPTHTILMFKENEKWWWFEHAWKPFKGIRGPYKTVKEGLENDVFKWLRNENWKDCISVRYSAFNYSGMNLDEFANHIVKTHPSTEGWFNKDSPPDPTVVDQYLATVSPKVRENVKVVSPEDLGTDTLFHVTYDPKIRSFNPRVSQKTMSSEDRSLPRVSTSPYIGGALAGYAVVEWEFNSERSRKDFRGGWYIYAIPFEYALKPNKEVQPDVEGTDEIWLVPYNDAQWKIIPKRIGAFFIEELRVRWEGRRRIVTALFCLENDSDTPIALSRDVIVKRGYWSFASEGFNNDFHTQRKYYPPVIQDLKLLTASEYALKKKLSASMLSYFNSNEVLPMSTEFVDTDFNLDDFSESPAFEDYTRFLELQERVKTSGQVSREDLVPFQQYLPESVSLEDFSVLPSDQNLDVVVSMESVGVIAAIIAAIIAAVVGLISMFSGGSGGGGGNSLVVGSVDYENYYADFKKKQLEWERKDLEKAEKDLLIAKLKNKIFDDNFSKLDYYCCFNAEPLDSIIKEYESVNNNVYSIKTEFSKILDILEKLEHGKSFKDVDSDISLLHAGGSADTYYLADIYSAINSLMHQTTKGYSESSEIKSAVEIIKSTKGHGDDGNALITLQEKIEAFKTLTNHFSNTLNAWHNELKNIPPEGNLYRVDYFINGSAFSKGLVNLIQKRNYKVLNRRKNNEITKFLTEYKKLVVSANLEERITKLNVTDTEHYKFQAQRFFILKLRTLDYKLKIYRLLNIFFYKTNARQYTFLKRCRSIEKQLKQITTESYQAPLSAKW